MFQRFNVRTAAPEGWGALWTVNLAGGRDHRVTPWDLRPATPRLVTRQPADPPRSNVDGPPDVSPNLYTTRPDGTHLQQLTFAQDGVTQYLGSYYSPTER